MSKRVAVLLVSHLAEALRDRRIETADSEPYWLNPEQFSERDGGVQLFPSKAGELMKYAQKHNMRPLGVVILTENGDCFNYLNEDAIQSYDRDFATKLFQAHVYLWFSYIPWLTNQWSAA